jgi:long-chain acyl-CoA synthetase
MTMTAGTLDTTRYPTPAPSVARMLYERVQKTPRAEAFRHPRNGGWTSVSWAQVGETVKVTAAGLLALGIRPEDRVAIASTTRIEWIYADLASMCAGAATTAVYPTTAGGDVAFILADSGTRIAFAEDDVQVAKLRAQRDHLPVGFQNPLRRMFGLCVPKMSSVLVATPS